MANLIDINDVIAYKPLSINLDVAKKLDPFIQEAENFDIKPFLSDGFFIDLKTNPTNYSDLLDGVDYTYNGDDYRMQGLKVALIYFSYSRYLSQANIHATAFGMVQKNNVHSENVDDKTISRLVKQNQSGAVVILKEIECYLNRNKALYPFWKKCVASGGSIKVRRIGI